MKFFKVVSAAVLALAFSLVAKADPDPTIANFYTSITASDSAQLGRPSRSSVPQDWSGTETQPQPAIINTGVTYYYKTFTYAASLFTGGGYLDITTYEPANTAVYFLTAYSYDPLTNIRTWLGDQGFSGNYQTDDGGAFQVILPAGLDLLLSLNTTGGGLAGLGTSIKIQVDNYSDSMYSPAVAAAATPEPSSLLLVGTGLLTVVGSVRRRMQMA